MLKIKDDIDLQTLCQFDYIKEGGTESCWYFYFYEKRFFDFINWYRICIDGKTREIKMFKNNTFEYIEPSFGNQIEVFKKRFIKDLIQAGLVEKV